MSNRTGLSRSVYSSDRSFLRLVEPTHGSRLEGLINRKNTCEGLMFMRGLPSNLITATFFDPQYRGVLDKLSYGNEGDRQIGRAELSQMDEKTIVSFINEITRVLRPSGHLFLWIDKFHLCEGYQSWLSNGALEIVDLITWDKARMGMGYRTRRQAEYLVVIQKKPKRAKGVWTKHNIPDVWTEKLKQKEHPHQKPAGLQVALIEAVSSPGEIILDPCAGSYSVMKAARKLERTFLGCDLV